jgi:hypothetical protein
LDGGGVVAVEVVPGPLQEGIGLAVHAAEQHRVDPDPRRERNRALHLVTVLADLCDGRVAADHRHDALVLVDERRRGLPVQLSDDIACCPLARLLSHRAQLGQRPALRRGVRDVRDVADGVAPRVAGDRQVREHVDAPASTQRRAGGLGDLRGGLATAPDHGPGRGRAAVVELDPVLVDGSDADAQPDLGASLGQLVVCVLVCLRGELTQQGVAAVDQDDPARPGQAPGLVQCVHQVGQRSRRFHTGRATSDHHHVELARLHRGLVLDRRT